MILSLRTRLLFGIITGTTILLTVFSLIIYTVTQQTMTQHFDKSLLASAKMLSAVIEEEGVKKEQEGGPKESGHEHEQSSEAEGPEKGMEIDFEFDVSMTPEFNDIYGGSYFQVQSFDGKILARSPSLGQATLERSDTGSGELEYRECILPDKKNGRSITYRFVPRVDKGDVVDESRTREERELHLTVAKEAEGLYSHLHFLKWLLFGSSIIVIFISTGLANLVTHTILQPVVVLAKKIESISKDNLDRRFPLVDFPGELHPICERMENLLVRLKESFEHESRFNKDVAHELRTPLSGMQTTLEVCLSRDRENEEYREAVHKCLLIVKTMNKLIDTLLSLSKLESSQISVQKDAINIKDLIDDHWRSFADLAYDKEISFENAIAEDLLCRSDKDRLGMVVSNLLDNAATYANEKGRIWVEAQLQEGSVVLSISNTGSILTQEEVGHVFDFFWRKDSSRTDTGRHCGIGLSVVRKVSDVLGIEVKAEIKEDGVFTMLVFIPG